MSKYRKKPVVIDAIQFDGSPKGAVTVFDRFDIPGGKFVPDRDSVERGTLMIPTLEGDHTARAGDFIIKGVKGGFYPCEADIFASTYDTVATLDLADHAPRASDEVLWTSNDELTRIVRVGDRDRAFLVMAGSSCHPIQLADGSCLVPEYRDGEDAMGQPRWSVDGTCYRVGPHLVRLVAEMALTELKNDAAELAELAAAREKTFR